MNDPQAVLYMQGNVGGWMVRETREEVLEELARAQTGDGFATFHGVHFEGHDFHLEAPRLEDLPEYQAHMAAWRAAGSPLGPGV